MSYALTHAPVIFCRDTLHKVFELIGSGFIILYARKGFYPGRIYRLCRRAKIFICPMLYYDLHSTRISKNNHFIRCIIDTMKLIDFPLDIFYCSYGFFSVSQNTSTNS